MKLIGQFFCHLHHFSLVDDVEKRLTHQDENALMVTSLVNQKTIFLHLNAVPRLMHQGKEVDGRRDTVLFDHFLDGNFVFCCIIEVERDE